MHGQALSSLTVRTSDRQCVRTSAALWRGVAPISGDFPFTSAPRVTRALQRQMGSADECLISAFGVISFSSLEYVQVRRFGIGDAAFPQLSRPRPQTSSSSLVKRACLSLSVIGVSIAHRRSQFSCVPLICDALVSLSLRRFPFSLSLLKISLFTLTVKLFFRIPEDFGKSSSPRVCNEIDFHVLFT